MVWIEKSGQSIKSKNAAIKEYFMSDNDIILSIIIPVYQAKDTINKCVMSCLFQKDISPSELEIIMVDDGSTDGSAEICDKLSSRYGDGKMRVIHTENGGVSHARNVGIDAAKGRFIAFVDSDDYVTNSFAANLIKHADESTVIVDETDSFISLQKISGFQYLENSVLNENTHVWGKIFDRNFLVSSNIRFEEGLTIGEDLLFMMDAAIAAGKSRIIRCLPEGDYNYFDNENGAMNQPFKRNYLDQIVCWRGAEKRLIDVKNNISPFAFVSVCVSQILTALLVAGKVAVQGKEKDKELDRLAVEQVKEQIEHALKTKGTFAALPLGHKIKVVIFRIDPQFYLKLYGGFKNRK